MTKAEQAAFTEAVLESNQTLLRDFESALRNERFKLGDIQAALSGIAEGDNPDECARGMAMAYEDCIDRIIRVLADFDCARDNAAMELGE